ncbi:MAG: ArsR/SmtB family transcription factor [Burkholderiales bacterium]
MAIEDFSADFYGQLAQVMKALSNSARLEILVVLAQGERTVDAVATEMRLSLPSASQHLQKLLQAGLVEVRKSGIHVHYRLADESVIHLINAATEIAKSRLAKFREVIDTYLRARDSMEPINADELLTRMQSNSVTIIDARAVEEYQSGHLPGAINLPYWEIDPLQIQLPADQEIVAYCRGPYCILSHETVARLRGLGFSVRRLRDGYPEWRARGYPVVN